MATNMDSQQKAIQELSNSLFEIKEKLTDDEYKTMYDQLAIMNAGLVQIPPPPRTIYPHFLIRELVNGWKEMGDSNIFGRIYYTNGILTSDSMPSSLVLNL